MYSRPLTKSRGKSPNIGIPIIIPIRGRGFINQGSMLGTIRVWGLGVDVSQGKGPYGQGCIGPKASGFSGLGF